MIIRIKTGVHGIEHACLVLFLIERKYEKW